MADNRLEERIADPNMRWLFTKEELMASPSRVHGIDYDKELSYRQQTANLIQEMGHRLKLNQICTATAIVYMHRVFIVHSFRTFNRWNIASAALFLAAKVEEQPQKLEYVARVFYSCLNRDQPNIDPSSEKFTRLIEDITTHELLILETLGFDLAVEHAHPHVVKCTQLVRASKDLSQTAYFMAHNSLLLTTFCLEHKPKVVACCCINLACVWKGVEIPPSQDQKKWWQYVDSTITQELLDSLTEEFLHIYGKCPSKLQKKINEQIKLAQKQNKLKQEEHGGDNRGKAAAHDSTSAVRHSRPPPNQAQKTSHSQHQHPSHGPHPPPHSQDRSVKHHHHHHQQQQQQQQQLPSGNKLQQSSHQNLATKVAHQSHHGKLVHASGDKESVIPQATKVHSTVTISSSSQQLLNNKLVSRPHESHHKSQMSGAHGQAESTTVAAKHVLAGGHKLPMTEKHKGIPGDLRSRNNPKHHHNHEGHVTTSARHQLQQQQQQQQQYSRSSKRPHPPNEVTDKKRVKLEPSLIPPLPPLPPISSTPPPPLPPQNYLHDYDISLPPLPPYPPMESPPPPPPQK